MFKKIHKVIKDISLKLQEIQFLKSTQKVQHHLLEFDFMIDKSDNMYLLEINLSPATINKKNSPGVKALKLKMYSDLTSLIMNDYDDNWISI